MPVRASRERPPPGLPDRETGNEAEALEKDASPDIPGMASTRELSCDMEGHVKVLLPSVTWPSALGFLAACVA